MALVAATVASYAIGRAIDNRLLLPILNTLAGFPFMVAALRAGRVPRAIGRMLVWAAAMGLCATTLAFWEPVVAEKLFIHGGAYKREMFIWVMTGQGAESQPSQFIPQHLAHTALFLALSLATGSLVSMTMGAMLMNYMSCYVGGLGWSASSPAVALLLGWHPWAVIRIASFVVLGVVLGGPLLGRLVGFPYRLADQKRWVVAAGCGLVADATLKWLLAPAWRQHLVQLLL
jgi:hypothetical protein